MNLPPRIHEIEITEPQRYIAQRARHAWRLRESGDPVGWLHYHGDYRLCYDATGLHVVDNVHIRFNGRYLPILVDPRELP